MKRCRNCNQDKPKKEFYSCSRYKDGLRGWCKDCDKASASSWSKANPERTSKNKYDLYIKKTYGISSNDIPNECQVCGGTSEYPGRRGVDVDHDHSTNRVRGFLCNPCNRALSAARESIPILEGLIKYLKETT